MSWRTPQLKRLAQALLSLKTEKAMLAFLRDLCTHEELVEFSARWHVVQLLEKGMSYRDIAQKTGMSTTTVTRIAYWLNHGEGGYRSALRRNHTP